MSDKNTARKALFANAFFSMFTGITCLSAAEALVNLMLTHPPEWAPLILRLLGLGLITFSLVVARIAAAPRVSRIWTMQIVQADLGWVIGTAALIWVYGASFTPAGLWLLWIVAALVGLFAVAQYLGAKGTFETQDNTLAAPDR